jgi:hypothetical protein
MARKKKTAKRMRSAGTGCIWPKGIELHFGISRATRWRWERLRLLPQRDVYVNGVPVGWKPSTIERAASTAAPT